MKIQQDAKIIEENKKELILKNMSEAEKRQ